MPRANADGADAGRVPEGRNREVFPYPDLACRAGEPVRVRSLGPKAPTSDRVGWGV